MSYQKLSGDISFQGRLLERSHVLSRDEVNKLLVSNLFEGVVCWP